MIIRMSFVDRFGQDCSATEETMGYHFADFFSSDIDEIKELSEGDADTADAWLKSAYKGPDIDGIGVQWIIVA